MSRIEFDPNQAPRGTWASYIEGRSPIWKVHRMKNHAINAINVKYPRNSGIAYQNIDGIWVEIARYDVPELCFNCKTTGFWPDYNKDPNSFYSLDELAYKRNIYWEPLNTYIRKPRGYEFLPKFTAPLVCAKCYHDHFKHNAKEPIEFPKKG